MSKRAIPYFISRRPGFTQDVHKLTKLLSDSKRLLVITGAGISTESGIPDYRGINGSYSKGHKPMTYQEFVAKEFNRKKYWSRSMLGWHVFESALPGPSHLTLASMEKQGIVHQLITQNVDRLHHKSFHNGVLELHGNLFESKCIKCKTIRSRSELQIELESNNSIWFDNYTSGTSMRPDGDVEFTGDLSYESFNLPVCLKCGEDGILKPNVVLFGENCDVSVVKATYEAVESADSILILGSSCTVFSVYRLLVMAKEKGIPIYIVNVGETRADSIASTKIEQPAGDILSESFKLLFKGNTNDNTVLENIS